MHSTFTFISLLIKTFGVVFINHLQSAGEKLNFAISMFFLCGSKGLNLSKCDRIKRNFHFSLSVLFVKGNENGLSTYMNQGCILQRMLRESHTEKSESNYFSDVWHCLAWNKAKRATTAKQQQKRKQKENIQGCHSFAVFSLHSRWLMKACLIFR